MLFANKLKNQKGFTLVELIVVLSVLAIIGIIAVPKFLGIQVQAKKDADVATSAMVADTFRVYVAAENTQISGLATGKGTLIAMIAETTVGSTKKGGLRLYKPKGVPALPNATEDKLQKYIDTANTVMQSGITADVYMNNHGDITVEVLLSMGNIQLYPKNEYSKQK